MCPSEVDLLEFSAGRAPLVAHHVLSCATCRDVLAAFAQLSRSGEVDSNSLDWNSVSPRDADASPTSHGLGDHRTDDVAEGLAAAAMPLPGDHVGRYQIVQLIAQGAMGAVFAAHDPSIDRRIAVKVLRAGTGPMHRARLLVEATLAARVQHPNVVTVYDVGAWRGHVFLAMELVDGTTLDQWSQGRSAGDVLRTLRDVTNALAAAHAQQVLHCDVKPANILVTADGRAKLGDFGLALAPNSAASRGARGTPAYMAPEVASGQPPSEASDQYSLCQTFLRLRTVAWPRNLQRALMRGVADHPAARWPTLAAFARACEPGRRKWIAVAAIAITTAAALTVTFRHFQTADVCRPQANFLAAWHEHEASLRAALGTGPLAQSTLQAIARYVASADAQQVEICLDSRVRGRYSDQIMDRRAACLDQLRTRFGAIVTAATASASSPSMVADAVDHLAEIRTCDDVAVLVRDEGIFGVSNETRAALDQAFAALELGRFAESQQFAHGVATSEAAKTNRAVRASALYYRGQAEMALDQREAANHTMTDAYDAALAAANDLLTIDSALELAVIENQDGHADNARAWLTRAAATLERVDSPRRQSRYWETKGHLAFDERNVAEAAESFAKAITWFDQVDQRETLGRTDSSQPNAWNAEARFHRAILQSSLAAALRSLGQRDESAALYAQSVAAIEATRGPDAPQLAGIYSNWGVLEATREQYPAALHAFARAQALMDKQLGPTHRKVLALRINIASTRMDQGDTNGARTEFENILTTLRALPLPIISHEVAARRALIRLAIQEKQAQRAIAQAQTLLADCRGRYQCIEATIASLHWDAGEALLLGRKPQRALREFEAATPAFAKAGNTTATFSLALLRARALEELGRITDARSIIEPLLPAADASPSERADLAWAKARLAAAHDRAMARTSALAARTDYLAANQAAAVAAIDVWLAKQPMR